MAVTKVLARGWTLEIQNPDTLAWVTVNGLKSFSFDSEDNKADTTTFDDDGWNSHLVASRGRKIGCEGYYLEDQVSKARDPGQILVEDYNEIIGPDSLAYFRLTSPAGTVRYFYASVSIGGVGGGNDDPTGWNAELTTSGAASLGEVLDTAISVTPATLSLAAKAISDVMAVEFTPANTTDRTITWSTSDSTKAVVTPEGRIVGIAAGSATITATSANNHTDTVAVTVT